jgi:hypothetical protein
MFPASRRRAPHCGALEAAEKVSKRCHSEEQQRRRISHGLGNTQSAILRCAQDDSIATFFRSLFSPAIRLDDQDNCCWACLPQRIPCQAPEIFYVIGRNNIAK